MDATTRVARIQSAASSARSSITGSTDHRESAADAYVEAASSPPPTSWYERRHWPTTAGPNGAKHRIALFTGNFASVTDGVSRTLQRLVKYLRARGHHVLIVGPSDPQISKRGINAPYVEVPSIAMPGRPEYRVSIGLPTRVCRRVDEFNPDLIHIATPDLLGIGALNWAVSRRLPVVSSYHTHFPSYLRYYRLEPLRTPVESYFRWFYSRCRQVYVPTAPLVAYFEQLGLRDNVRLWGRGVDCLRFHPRHRSVIWRRQHSIGPDDHVVAYVGRLVKEKGMDVLESVMHRLHALMPSVRTVIVGDGPMRAQMEEKLPNTIFKGHLDGAELATAYASSDIFLFPSASEAFGNVIVEAMASGLPVVCADASGSSAHVRGRDAGLLAAPGDSNEFLKHVLTIIQNPAMGTSMGLCGRRHAQNYDWPITLDLLAYYYDEVLSEP